MTTGKRRTLMATAMVIMTSAGGREPKPKPTNTVPGIEYILADTAQPGLNAGDRIVVGGMQRVRPGVTVTNTE
jgi:hypothetical protein